jgi:hypothetical protein
VLHVILEEAKGAAVKAQQHAYTAALYVAICVIGHVAHAIAVEVSIAIHEPAICTAAVGSRLSLLMPI